MALTKNAPNTIYLGGPFTKLNEHVAGAIITPGMQIELADHSGKMKWRPVNSATTNSAAIFAIEKSHHNKTVDDNYAIGDLVLAYHMGNGGQVWALVPSGNDIAAGDYLQPDGSGYMKEATADTSAAGVGRYKADEALGVVNELTRCKTTVLF